MIEVAQIQTVISGPQENARSFFASSARWGAIGFLVLLLLVWKYNDAQEKWSMERGKVSEIGRHMAHLNADVWCAADPHQYRFYGFQSWQVKMPETLTWWVHYRSGPYSGEWEVYRWTLYPENEDSRVLLLARDPSIPDDDWWKSDGLLIGSHSILVPETQQALEFQRDVLHFGVPPLEPGLQPKAELQAYPGNIKVEAGYPGIIKVDVGRGLR
jgi:hypothetical protein